MSVTITYEFREGGALFDPESVDLSSADGTYGVRREDTQGVIVAAGTVMVRSSVGVYTYTINDEPSEVDLEYVVRALIAGTYVYAADVYDNTSGDAPVEPVGPDGRYATTSGMYLKFGQVSVDKWATLHGNTEAERTEAIRSAIDRADTYIDAVLSQIYDVPFTAAKEGIPLLIRDIANMLAGVYLYEAQGVVDFNPDTGQVQHRFRSTKRDAEQQLARIKVGHIDLVNPDGELVTYNHKDVTVG